MANELPRAPIAPGTPSLDSIVCRWCARDIHPFDVLCPHCRATLVSDPTREQLVQAERLARIRSHLASTLHDQRSSEPVWTGVAKLLLPIAATLIVAVGGWWITSTYNDAQIQVQKAQQAASRASSEASASLAYLQFLANAPTQEQRDQALGVVAAILPPELSFSLAVKRLPEEPVILNLLLRSYGDQSWKYLSPFIEDTSTAEPVLRLLHEQNVLDREFNWLISTANDRPHRRLPALVSYFEFLSKLDSDQHPAVHKPATRALVNRILNTSGVDAQTKSDLAAAAALVFVPNPNYTPDWDLLDMAASVFWEGINTNIGELPQANSPKYRLYNLYFHFRVHDGLAARELLTPAANIASKALVERLLTAPLQDMTVYDLGRLLYSYCEERTYLNPDDVLRFVREVLGVVNTTERRKLLSLELGSLNGNSLYHNMGRDSAVRREYAVLIVDWYSRYATRGWAIPKFLSEVEVDYPDLKGRIETIFKATRLHIIP